MADLKTQTPTETLDVLGRVCPYPLVLTKKQLEKMSSGAVLKSCVTPLLPLRIPFPDLQINRDSGSRW